MRIKGRLLYFDTLDPTGRKFSHDCKFTIPDKVPIVENFRFGDMNSILGSASVLKDDKGLVFEADLLNLPMNQVVVNDSEEFGVGGYYNRLRYAEHNEFKYLVEEAEVRAMSIIPRKSIVNPDYIYEVVEENK